MKKQNWKHALGFMVLLFLVSGLAIGQNPYPNTGDHIVCLNSTQPYGVVLTAGSTYNWSITPITGGNGTITAGVTPNLITVNWTNVGTATLQIVETNANGCAGNPVSIMITVQPEPTVSVNSPVTCSGTAATLTATPGVAGTYTYTWTVPGGATNPGNTATFTSAVAGIYSVVITDVTTGCASAPANGIITLNASPNLVINQPAAICPPGTVDITGPAITAGSTGGLSFTYWTDVAATIPYTTPTNATAGTYYIKGTNGFGCFDIKPVTVTLSAALNLVINQPAAICPPGTVDLTAPAITAGSTAGLSFTYWTDAAATIPYATPTNATTGTYYIKGTTGSGCFDIKPVTVVISAAPSLVITNPAPACSTTVDITAASVTAGSSPGITLSYWTDAAATIPYATPGAATAGTYYIKGALAGGCSDIKPVTVTVNPLPTPLVAGKNPVCESINAVTEVYLTPNIVGHTYVWTVAGGTISSGQNTNSIAITWTTPGAGSVSVMETITATGCNAVNKKPITITAKPATSPISHN